MSLLGKYKNFRHLVTSIVETIKAGYPAKNLIVIGVTGTDGKTTTAHLIYEILKAAGKKVELISTITAPGLHTTTPDATVLQPLLKKFLRQGVRYVILEATSHGIDQHRVFGCNFYAAVLTNISHEHLDYHKTFENYRKTKAKLFRGVKIAVLNKDDKSFNYFRGSARSAKIISYGINANANFKAEKIGIDKGRTKFTLNTNGEKYKFQTRLLGNYNISNILAAISLTRDLGIDWPTIKKAISSFKPIAGRMEFIQIKPFSVIVDFAHTPNGLKSTLDLLRTLDKKRLIAVLGSAGERDTQKRSMMGRVAAELADISIFTAEDPRSDSVHDILDQMADGAQKAGGREGKTFFKIAERGEAIAYAIKIAKPQDIVGIFGKGHERSLAYDHTEHPWSDQEFAKAVLSAKAAQSSKEKAAIVLAAGRGTRMQSDVPKVLHKISGRPMISYSLENLRKALFEKIVVVVGYGKEEVKKEIGGAVDIAVQPKPLGNANAVSYGLKKIEQGIKNVMIVQGDDSAFYTPTTLGKLIKQHTRSNAKITLATIFKKDPGKLGVVKRDKKGNILGIEHWNGEGKPPSAGEINCGLWVFNRAWLEKALPKIKKNEKGEYYLTDVIPIAISEKAKIQTVKIPEEEWVGVNTPEELAIANQKMQEKLWKISRP